MCVIKVFMINHITIKNYRNIHDFNWDLGKFNYIIAPNGKGKTNILESIYYSAFRNSFRPQISAHELIAQDSSFLRVLIDLWDNHKFEYVISKNESNLERKFVFDGKETTKTKVFNNFAVVLFAPHSVDLVNGSPQTRRDDLDAVLSIISKNYSDNVARYSKVLKNRNAVLKSIRERKSSENQLEFWTNELANLCGLIQLARVDFFYKIDAYVTRAAAEIYHDEGEFKIIYSPNIECTKTQNEITKTYLTKFAENREKEIIVGKTLYGVHKDDYYFEFASKNLKYFGSRGQQRIGSLAWKLAHIFYLKHIDKNDITFLIDDLMSELDKKHRSNIAKLLIELDIQWILTGADIQEIPKIIIEKSKQISIKN